MIRRPLSHNQRRNRSPLDDRILGPAEVLHSAAASSRTSPASIATRFLFLHITGFVFLFPATRNCHDGRPACFVIHTEKLSRVSTGVARKNNEHCDGTVASIVCELQHRVRGKCPDNTLTFSKYYAKWIKQRCITGGTKSLG